MTQHQEGFGRGEVRRATSTSAVAAAALYVFAHACGWRARIFSVAAAVETRHFHSTAVSSTPLHLVGEEREAFRK